MYKTKYKKTDPFLALHNHSRTGSLRDCVSSIPEVVDICSKNNMSFTLTDHGSLGGVFEYYKSAKKNGVKFVPGNEIYANGYRDRMFVVRDLLKKLKPLATKAKGQEKVELTKQVHSLALEFEDIKKPRHLLLFAKNEHGYHNLIELSNLAYSKGFYGKPMNTYKEIFDLPKDKDGSRGLIITTACLGSESSQYLIKENRDAAHDWIGMMQEEIKDEFFVELQPNGMEIQKQVNAGLIDIARKLNIPLVVGTDSHYTDMKYNKLHELFLLMQGKQKVSDIGKKQWRITYQNKKGEILRKKVDKDGQAEFFGTRPDTLSVDDKVKDNVIKKIEEVDKVWLIEAEDLSFKTEKQLRDVIKKHEELVDLEDELVDGNKYLYSLVEDIEIDGCTKLPAFENEDELLKQLCVKGLMSKKKEAKDPRYIERLKSELDLIKKGRLASYFLILSDLVRQSINIGVPVGPCRGSGGAFLVNYLIGITRIDPILWGEKTGGLFDPSRFLNPERVSVKEVISLETEEGTITYDPEDMVVVTRNGKEITIQAKDIEEGDNISET